MANKKLSHLELIEEEIGQLNFLLLLFEINVVIFATHLLGGAFDIPFIGHGLIAVSTTYFALMLIAFTTQKYRSVFVFMSGLEHYSMIFVDLLRVFALLAFVVFVVNLRAGRPFFLIGYPLALLLHILSRRIQLQRFKKDIRNLRILLFTDEAYIREYLVKHFENVDIRPLKQFNLLLEEQDVNETYDSVILFNFQKFGSKHEEVCQHLLDINVPIAYLTQDTFLKSWAGQVVILGPYLLLVRSSNSISLASKIAKRSLDLTLSIIGLLLLSPIFILYRFLFKRNAAGENVIFKQSRIGKDGKTFEIYKLRTVKSSTTYELVENFEMPTARAWRAKPDPSQLLPGGAFLRRWSIDEFPQLLNVMKGEMSIVGPRPRLQEEVDERHSTLRKMRAKPGITGLWQISGRNHIAPNQADGLDNYYVDHWSLIMDLQIIFKTIRAVVTGFGAS